MTGDDPLTVELATATDLAAVRALRAVVGMHAPLESTGRCPWCHPRPARRRWWRRDRGPVECQTRRVIAAELATATARPDWTSA